jgi:hypothetical protein
MGMGMAIAIMRGVAIMGINGEVVTKKEEMMKNLLVMSFIAMGLLFLNTGCHEHHYGCGHGHYGHGHHHGSSLGVNVHVDD